MQNKGVNISNMTNIMVVLTFFFLWVTVFFGEQVEQTLALLSIFSFGILHGANDIDILRRTRPGVQTGSWNRKILFSYIGFVIVIAGLFYAVPLMAFLFFILFSAYHFGEQHWYRKASPGIARSVLFISYGLVVLCLLFAAHGPEVSGVIQDITGIAPETSWYAILGWTGFAGFCIALPLNLSPRQLLRSVPLELFLLCVFWVVFQAASLIWAFAIYFILWHAIPSLADQVSMLYGNLSPKAGWKYLKSSAVYWVASLASLAVAFFYFRDSDMGFLPLFFSFLAAITFPHVLVMSGLYRR